MDQVNMMKKLIEYAYEKMVNNNAYPFAAFVVKNGEIISKGYNYKVNDFGDKTSHGEMEALTKANQSLNLRKLVILDEGYELYSTCEPCLACFDTALWANINKFVFSVDHTDFPDYFNDHKYTIEDYEAANPQQIKVVRGVLRGDGISLFKKAKDKYGW